jgi:leader peptidase (prepilin peptidase)/N-methyltransferase
MDTAGAPLPYLLELYLRIVAFVLGASVGSFLNVVIARLPEGLSIVRPGSRCPRCLTPIAWYDNVPLLSWLALRAKCRKCGLPISARYPMVELITALLFLGVLQKMLSHPDGEGVTLNAAWLSTTALLFAFVALLIAGTYIDLDHWIIPWELTIPGIILGLISGFVGLHLNWFDSVIGALSGFGIFAMIGFLGRLIFKKEALGEGDWWLLAMIGAFLGWQSLLPVILLASLQGSVVGILLIVLGRNEKGEPAPEKDEAPATEPAAPAEKVEGAATEDDEDDWVPPANAVPFGPFLALAALEQLFVGDWLRMIYDNLIQRMVS